jgi:hypothetical protein
MKAIMAGNRLLGVAGTAYHGEIIYSKSWADPASGSKSLDLTVEAVNR